MTDTLCCRNGPFVRYTQCRRLVVHDIQQWAEVPDEWWWAVKQSNEAERNRLHSPALHLHGGVSSHSLVLLSWHAGRQ